MYFYKYLRDRQSFLLVMIMSISLLSCAGAASKTGSYIDDGVITTKIKSKLLATKNVSGTAISVETNKGVVQLSGFVKTGKQRVIAENIAKQVQGVRRVINSIQVE